MVVDGLVGLGFRLWAVRFEHVRRQIRSTPDAQGKICKFSGTLFDGVFVPAFHHAQSLVQLQRTLPKPFLWFVRHISFIDE